MAAGRAWMKTGRPGLCAKDGVLLVLTELEKLTEELVGCTNPTTNPETGQCSI